MKNRPLFSRMTIFVFTVMMTGIVGSYMMVRNFGTHDRIKPVKILILSVLVFQIALWVILFCVYPAMHQWNLSETVGWGWDRMSFAYLTPFVIKYLAINVFIGLLFILPVWNRCLKLPKD